MQSYCLHKVVAYFTENISQQLYRRKQLQVPKTYWVFNHFCHSNYFLSAVPASDHILSRLITHDLLQLCFSVFQSDGSRRRAELEISGYISKSHLLQIYVVIQWTTTCAFMRHHSTFHLNNLTITSLFWVSCFLLLATFFLLSFTAAARDEEKSFHLEKLLQHFVSTLYWLPTNASSKLSDSDFVRRSK